MKKNIKMFLLIIFGIGLISSIYNISLWLIDNYHTKKVTKLIKDATIIIENDTDVKEDKTSNEPTYELVNKPDDLNDSYYEYTEVPFLKIGFDDLKKINSDVVSYISIPGTSINYPVVQSSDNEFYLTHSFDKKYNQAGWIYMDYRNDPYDYGKNTVIYGHRRKDGSMFASLNNLLKKDWFNDKSNRIIKLSNEKENSIWQIFSVYKIHEESYYIMTKFKTDDIYQEFLDTIKKRSIFDFKTGININDKILTLSTCYDLNGNRIVVHAKLIKKGN